ncbi:TetR/AcrR family transcriptional regulator [Jiulongibacter sediminis]|jgi:TetR/AcrR family transcriptional repressor of nem operon|uniref:TetR/AcrR family transcriptional regulator n=1 Tax=Jiulongibacter sediminis TaxID=1605367 RepID=UPI0026EC3FFC|nr:TetR/AcrR family transcriptional regulator [Jiulongibacter sediminis]
MPLIKTNKEEIIDTALNVFRENGYYNTSMSDLAKACGLQKGSFYHYFDSKEKMMSAVLDKVLSTLKAEVFLIADDMSISGRDRLQKLMLSIGEIMLQKSGGCIAANTSLETNGQSVIFRDTLKAIFDGWQNALQKIFSSQYPEGTSKRLAEQTVMEFEGAVMLSQLHGHDQYLKDVFVRTLTKMK